MSIPLRLILPLYAEASLDWDSKVRISSQLHDRIPLRHSYSVRRYGFGYSSSKTTSSSSSCRQSWLCGCTRGDQGTSCWKNQFENGAQMFGSDDEITTKVPTQVQSVVESAGTMLVSEPKPIPDLDYLQELLAIQQQGPRAIGFFGTRNMGFMHQQLIEVLSYAMVITKNHIYTSGASGTNAAVIRGALRAEKPELLTVILPQSLKMQPPESQELLSKVKNVIEKPYNDHLPLIEASRYEFPSSGYMAHDKRLFILNSSNGQNYLQIGRETVVVRYHFEDDTYEETLAIKSLNGRDLPFF